MAGVAGVDQRFRIFAEAIADMAELDRDYGTERNDQGFNRFDSQTGHALAELPFERWTDVQVRQAARILSRYKSTQLPALGYQWAEFPDVDTNEETVVSTGSSVNGFATITVVDGMFRMAWGGADPYFRQRLNDVKDMTIGARYDKENKAWNVPVTLPNIDAVAAILGKYADTQLPFDEPAGFRDAVSAEIEAMEHILAASSAEAMRDPAALSLHRISKPDIIRPFQLAGIAFATATKQTIIADSPGLGKTVQSIAAVCENDALPCLVICPASLKLNWKREILQWVGTGLDGREPIVQVADGTKPTGVATIGGTVDFLVINYDVLHGWKDTLIAHGWKSIIADEAHMAKSSSARRSKALKAIIKAVDPEYRLLLTGTPILNRPAEIWPLLDLINGQRQFGGWWAFANEFCAPQHNGFGYNFNGASNLEELNLQLRSSGLMIRRLKEDVLKELPDKQWSPVPLPLAPAALRREYLHAARDLDDYLATAKGTAADIQAGALQRIGVLRQLAWKAKEQAARGWIDDFLQSGKKLIVFGWHRDAVESIASAYNAPMIMGGMKKEAVEEGKRRFQEDPDCNLIVCNIAAGGVGHTLTAASDVAFVEFAWNDALMDQAISRAHRLGQQDSVTGWLLTASLDGDTTIDDEMIEKIRMKGEITRAATDGNKQSTRLSALREMILQAEDAALYGEDTDV